MPRQRPTPLPPGPSASGPEAVAESQRQRLVDVMVELCFEQGYDAVTIGALTSRARTAKRTFYVHFDDREACFLAAYERCDAQIFEAIVAGAAGSQDPYERIVGALGSLLALLAADPALAHLLMLEAPAVGARAAARRLQTDLRLADLYIALHEQVADPAEPPMSRTRALAVVGAVDLPIRNALREDDASVLPALTTELARAAFTLVYGAEPPAN